MTNRKPWCVSILAGCLVVAACANSGSVTATGADHPIDAAGVSGVTASRSVGSEPNGDTGAGTESAPNSLPNTGAQIDVMGWSTGDEVGTSRVDYVKKQDPKLNITVDQNGFDEQKFATAMASGTVPAGVSMDRQLLATYAAKGFLEPLDQCISADGIDMSQFYPESVKESTWNGHIYGIPEFYTVRAVYIDNRVLKAAGLTPKDIDTSDWTKIADDAAKMYRKSGGKPSVIGFDPKIPEFLPLWVMADGGSIVDDSGRPSLNDPKVVESLQWAVDLINAQGGWANFKSFRDTWDFFGSGNEFVKDQIGAMPFEQWYANTLSGFEKADFSVIPFKSRDGKPLTFETGSAFAIPKGSPNAGGMCEFMKLVTSTDAWMAAAAARQAKVEKDKSTFTGIFTANQAANNEMRKEYVKDTDTPISHAVETFYDALDSAKMIPPSPAGQQIQQAYQQAATDALGGKDVKGALEAAQKAALDAYQSAVG